MHGGYSLYVVLRIGNIRRRVAIVLKLTAQAIDKVGSPEKKNPKNSPTFWLPCSTLSQWNNQEVVC